MKLVVTSLIAALGLSCIRADDGVPGILGLQLNPIPQGMQVVDHAPGGAASGYVFAFDGITSVNGTLVPKTVEATAALIRGDAGTSVDLTLLRRCGRHVPLLSMPVTLKRGFPTQHPLLWDVISDADYLWQLARINRLHIIDTSYAESTNDKYSLQKKLQRLITLELAVTDNPRAGVISKALRDRTQKAIQFDAAACAINQVWDDFRDSNLKSLQQAAGRMGFNLFSDSEDNDRTLAGFAASVIGRSLMQIQSHAVYQQMRSKADPHGAWRALMKPGSGNFTSLPLDLEPFKAKDHLFMMDPNWQFIRRLDLPFDQYPKLGNDILQYPPTVSRMNAALSARKGYAKIKVNNLTGNGRWRITLDVPERRKYFFVLVKTDKGILGITENFNGYSGGLCTWASAYDAFHANNGAIGQTSDHYSGQFDFSVIHRDLPMLGEEGGPASGTIYFWTTDTPEFPKALWNAPHTDSLAP